MILQSVLLAVYCLCRFFPNLDLDEKSSIPSFERNTGLPTVVDLNSPEVQNVIQTGLMYAYVENFDSATSYFNEVIHRYPKNPAGYFFKAALLQVKMMDRSQHAEEEEYFALLRQAIRNAEDILEQEENLWATFYLGSSYTYRAVYEGLKSNFWEAFNYGLKGGKILQGIIKSDSTFYDAYLGAGSYEYFWARASRYLFIPNVGGGNVEEAIRKLHVAADRGLYSGPTAKNSLVFVYGEEKIFHEADPIIDELLTTFPQGKTFLWSKAELEFKRENYATAVTHYAELFSRYNSETNKNYANLAQCKLYMGRCYATLGEKDSARTAFKAVITYKDYSGDYPIIKDYCREAYGMLSRIF